MFTLRVIQAKFGDCLIIIYGDKSAPKYMLIDGGPGGVYPNFLRPELQKIRDTGGELELMVLSHIDGDHIVGLINLTNEIREQQADETDPIINIKGIWMNSFSGTIGKDNQLTNAVQSLLSKVQNIRSTMPHADLALQSLAQGNTLRRNALLLEIPINEIANGGVITNTALPEPFALGNLSIRIIGPNAKNLEILRKEWEEWIRNNEEKVMMADAEIKAYLDKSVPNLSSIMFLMEAEGKSILFTGDGRGDFILEGLKDTGLTDEEGNLHVDVLKVPHHGSVRNTEMEFFEKITADSYVISGDGHHGNPEFETLSWIVTAAKKQERNIKLVCTNETDACKKLVVKYPQAEYNYEMTYLDKDKHALDIALG